jgi:YVTN family beta-propeller protein
MRRKQIASYQAANQYLEQAYLPEHNRRIARPAAQAEDYHGRKPTARDLQEIFRLKTERTISNDWVIRHEGRWMQLHPGQCRKGPTQSKALVCEWEQGVIQVYYRKADAESGCTAPASDPRDGDEPTSQGTSLATTLSNHEAVADEADARRADCGNAPLRFALTTGLRSRTHTHESHQPQKRTFLMSSRWGHFYRALTAEKFLLDTSSAKHTLMRLRGARMKRYKRQSLSATYNQLNGGAFRKRLLDVIGQRLTLVLLLLLSLGSGFGTATAQGQTRAYVTNLSGTVSVVNTTTNAVIATIPVGIFPSGVAITPDGSRAYVVNIINSISVIDTTTNTVVTTIPSGQFPSGIAITPDGSRAYVVNQFVDNQGSNTVSVVDTMTNTIVATISVGRGPSKIAITPDGTRAYVPNQQDFIISVIDTATNTVVTTIPVNGTAGIAITPDGTKAYVTSPGAGTVSVVDIATNTVVATISVGTNQTPFDVAITPNGTRAYVTINSPNVVAVIDTATNTMVATISVGAGPVGVAVTPDGTRAYVTNDNSNTVSVIDTASNMVIATIPVGVGPVAVAITPAPQIPTDKEQCKHHGYLKFGPPAGPFENQGQCVRYVEHH